MRFSIAPISMISIKSVCYSGYGTLGLKYKLVTLFHLSCLWSLEVSLICEVSRLGFGVSIHLHSLDGRSVSPFIRLVFRMARIFFGQSPLFICLVFKILRSVSFFPLPGL